MAGQRKPASEMHGLLEELSELLGLDDDERSSFIGSSMKRAGYKPRVEWDDGGNDDGNDGGDFFSRRRESGGDRQPRQSQRRVGGGGGGYTG